MPVYWIDAGVLIQAERDPYPQKMLPQFWQFLHEQLEAGIIKMPRIAYEEVTEGGYTDALCSWCKLRKQIGLCKAETKAVQERYGQIVAHIQSKHKQHHVMEFLKGGDGWVIAYALETEGIVVTQEIKKSKKSKIKIPAVAGDFDVRCISTRRMLDELGADFSK